MLLCKNAALSRTTFLPSKSLFNCQLMSTITGMTELKLNNLRDNDGAMKPKTRVGRGNGSGKGRTCGRGAKGQKARGPGPRLGFEGGQTPLYRRIPKRGFNNKTFATPMDPLNVAKLQHFIDMGRIDTSKVITLKTLRDSGVVGPRIKHGVKLLGKHAEYLKSSINIEVSRASASAIAAVEAAGGTIKTIHLNRLALRAELKPEKFDILPKRARPPPRLMAYYTNYEKRGFLSPEVQEKEARLKGHLE